jgi:hypothetical protein
VLEVIAGLLISLVVLSIAVAIAILVYKKRHKTRRVPGDKRGSYVPVAVYSKPVDGEDPSVTISDNTALLSTESEVAVADVITEEH